MSSRLPEFFPDTLHQRLETLDAERKECAAGLAEIETTIAAIRSKLPIERTPKDLTAVTKSESRRCEILVKQLQLVDQEAEILHEIRNVAVAIQNDADNAVPAAEADVRQKLISIGFIDCTAVDPAPGMITPGMVQGHPQILAARNRVREIRGFVDSLLAWTPRLEAARQQLGQELHTAQVKLAPALA